VGEVIATTNIFMREVLTAIKMFEKSRKYCLESLMDVDGQAEVTRAEKCFEDDIFNS
jgi:hypothetical protein